MNNESAPNPQQIPPQPVTPVTEAPKPIPNPALDTAAPAQSQITPSKTNTRRVITFIFGLLLLIFGLSILQGQATHSWDAIGVIMILFFGGIGLFLIYASIVQKK